MFDWVTFASIVLYLMAMVAIFFFFCYKTLRPGTICPVCNKGKLRILIRGRVLECDECQSRFRGR